jgi:hypothetical protein
MGRAERASRHAAIGLLALGACGGPQAPPRFHGCLDATQTPGSARLVLNHVTDVPPPCPLPGESYVSTPIRLTPGLDGLRVQFEVVDRSFVVGTYRQPTGERDAVVVFPSGESPGRASVDLALDSTPRGYRVDDVLPWETWGFHDADGDFRFLCAVIDRDATGSESETRISLHVTVRPQP